MSATTLVLFVFLFSIIVYLTLFVCFNIAPFQIQNAEQIKKCNIGNRSHDKASKVCLPLQCGAF